MKYSSDETPSGQEEICSPLCWPMSPTRSSNRYRMSPQQPLTCSDMLVNSSSRMVTPVNHTDFGNNFQSLPPSPTQHCNFQHRLSSNHHMLELGNFLPVHLSTVSEPMRTPRPEYLSGSLCASSFPLQASSLQNDWPSRATDVRSIHPLPFSATCDLSSPNGSHVDGKCLPQHKISRKTTIVLEDIEERTLSKVLDILIREKARLRMETDTLVQGCQTIGSSDKSQPLSGGLNCNRILLLPLARGR
jgi:hypothetical protein